MDQPADTIKVGKYLVKIFQDYDVTDPRKDWDHAGVMVCFHQHYNLGDKHNFGSPEDFDEWYEEHQNEIEAILPLYLYDHSGITMSCSSFQDRWDSGQVGYIYLTKDICKKEGISEPEQYLRSEVNEYDMYLTGDVWGYVITDADGDEIDSCWGFFGFDYCKKEAIDCVPDPVVDEDTFEAYIEGLTI